MNTDFYKEFEKRYRGSRELIKKRLQAYLPFIEPLKEHYPVPEAIDLGCGRGEWLELISEIGFNACGVDLDEGMLEHCLEKGLNVKTADAIETVQTLDSDSQAIVSAFHVVEHISFDKLQILVREALRVLKPGGLLIMETPNPENITVATKNFYLDPTHIKPIPSELLSFLPEYHGFKRIKVMGLQESTDLAARQTATLADVLSGASPDYAVVAQKDAAEDVLSRFDYEFNKSYGLPLATLAERYDHQIHLRIDKAQNDAQAAQKQAREFHDQLSAVYNSYSWKVTWPLRKSVDIVKWLLHLPGSLIARLMAFAIRRENLRLKLLSLINRLPWLKALLTSIGQKRGVLPKDDLFEYQKNLSTKKTSHGDDKQETALSQMTPRARKIYHDLKTAIEQHKKDKD